MKCWDCGQELDTSHIESDARALERARIAWVLNQGARILRDSGDPGWKAVDALAQELDATRSV